MFKASPTLTADLRRGDETQVLFMLQKDGVTPGDFTALGHNDALRTEVVAVLMKYRLFTGPEEQVTRLLEINERLWKDFAITHVAIRNLGEPPEYMMSDRQHLIGTTLVYETGNPLETLKRNWAACVFVHGKDRARKDDRILFTPAGVRLRPGAKLRKPGLRWAVAELGRLYMGQSVNEARSLIDNLTVMGMGQELPAFAAMHPQWVCAMKARTISFAVAPDLEVKLKDRRDFDCALCICVRGNGEVLLDAVHIDPPFPAYGSSFLPR